MASISNNATNQIFRKSFALARGADVTVKWYPRHMYIANEKLNARAIRMDALVEVHDARIPFSGRNDHFSNLCFDGRPHIFVLNKMDLIYSSDRPQIEQSLRERNPHLKHILWANCFAQKTRRKIVKELQAILLHELQSQSMRAERMTRDFYSVMVVGIPNVGKSSLINALRSSVNKPDVLRVGNRPGVTRLVEERIQISFTPPIYIVDTPGILAPKIADLETGMKLVLCYCIPESVLPGGVLDAVDYLLYWMNKERHLEYVQLFGFPSPCDQLMPFLARVAEHQGMYRRKQEFLITAQSDPPQQHLDLYQAAHFVLDQFRTGVFGKWVLDDYIH